MPCFHPITAAIISDNCGIVQKKLCFGSIPDGSSLVDTMTVACGNCLYCRVRKRRAVALRIVHEAKMWPQNCFLTLTYNDKSLPYGSSLAHRDVQLFMKSLRQELGFDHPLRYYMCGEYGRMFLRPHYHLILFNWSPDDLYRVSSQYYASVLIDRLWKHGFNTIGSVTDASAGYVASYCCKKLTGEDQKRFLLTQVSQRAIADDKKRLGKNAEFLTEFDHATTMRRVPEYTQGSVGREFGGIGRPWFDEYVGDVFPKGYVTHNAKICPAPDYYRRLYKSRFPDAYDHYIRGVRSWSEENQLSVEELEMAEKAFKLSRVSGGLRRSLECNEGHNFIEDTLYGRK